MTSVNKKNDNEHVFICFESKNMNQVLHVTHEHLTEAARLLGKGLIDHVTGGRQALLLTDQSYLNRLALGSVNRDVNPKWVSKLKAEMSRLIMSRERTLITACIDLREVQRVIEEQNGATDFKASILDGQHRITCLKELFEEHPTMKYDFWLQIYIVSSDIEMMQLISDFDKRLVISAKDKKTMQDRHTFVESFLELIPRSHHHRRCITGIRNHKALRDDVVVNALQKSVTSKDTLQNRFRAVAEKYKESYDKSPPKNTSVLAKLIDDTKLYFLIDWEGSDWIYDVLCLQKKENKLIDLTDDDA